MSKKLPFFPAFGCLSGAMSVAAGFYLDRSAKSTAAQLLAAQSPTGNGYGDLFSYYFGSQPQTVDASAQILAGIYELIAKGFGLLLIFLGLIAVFGFASKIEKALRARPAVFMPENGFMPENPDLNAQFNPQPCPDFQGGFNAQPEPDFAAAPPQPPVDESFTPEQKIFYTNPRPEVQPDFPAPEQPEAFNETPSSSL